MPPTLEILPLGGLGEFGMNTMLYRVGDDGIVVDAGMMFAGPELPGVDAILPDLSSLDDCPNLHGVVLTHGHEDHIGGVPALLERRGVPVWGTAHALELTRRRVGEHDDPGRVSWNILPPDGTPLPLGPFVLRSLAVAHSIPLSKMFLVGTPCGTVLHTGDFKLSPAAPHPGGTDLAALQALGNDPPLLMLSDSTNAEEPGVTPPEPVAAAEIQRAIAASPARVVVTCFASNVERIAGIAAAAARCGRKLAVVGSALDAQLALAERLGLVRLPAGVRESVERLMERPRHEGVLVVAGSQGEPGSALRRIARGVHPDVSLAPGDRVLHSARIIPGNERRIGALVDRLLERGVEVETGRERPLHVSGHASRDELARLIERVRPRYFVPMHGEYRQLQAHARIAREAGLDPTRITVARSGDRIALRETGVEIVDHVEVPRVFRDAQRREVSPHLLRERQRIAVDGMVVALVILARDGVSVAESRILTRGFVRDLGTSTMQEIREVVERAVGAATTPGRGDPERIEERIRIELRRFLRRRLQRRPLVLPLIVESGSS